MTTKNIDKNAYSCAQSYVSGTNKCIEELLDSFRMNVKNYTQSKDSIDARNLIQKVNDIENAILNLSKKSDTIKNPEEMRLETKKEIEVEGIKTQNKEKIGRASCRERVYVLV